MKSTNEQAERLVDEAVRELAQPPAVDLRARVMAAIADDRARGARRPTAAPRHWLLAWRPALILANAVLILVVVLLYRGSGIRDQGSGIRDQGSGKIASAPISRQAPAPTISAPLQAMLRAARPAPGLHRANTRGALRSAEEAAAGVPGTAAVDQSASGPYMPGAPAGDLGDPLQPMPAPPPVAIAPITELPIVSPPPVSEMTRPVTDFPADSPTPDSPARTPGKSGGSSR